MLAEPHRAFDAFEQFREDALAVEQSGTAQDAIRSQ